ncbi:MAG: low-specificity L-threonine aldolase [Planctomycetales bacterium]|nr:low-specificity L-threonine aldolase [Planctomycetales bacterium]
MKTIDLRSDTVTLPTEAMYEAMRTAPLGDDVLGDDPTVIKLERLAAERMGKEAALLTPSGTMANLIGVLTHCGRGDEVILGDKSHTFVYEAGGISAYGGVHPHTLPNQPDGTLGIEQVEAAIRPNDVHFPRTRLICLENTHNKCGGVVLNPAYLEAVGTLTRRYGLKFHIDGARIFNASVALGVDVRQLTCWCDSVAFCLSKGLCCPLGSVLCGPADYIVQARRIRKGLGGGMRQAGIIAAAGIVALETMVDRLAEDHANAALLARGLSEIDGIDINLNTVKTNMVYFSCKPNAASDEALLERTAARGVLFLQIAPRRFRLVAHHGIDADDICQTLQIIADSIA